MCGIVGYFGQRQAFPILIRGLHRLEYRGYDSAGVALLDEHGDLQVYKTKGKVQDLENYCKDKNVTGCVGIAHTRWATHGEPSSNNAHPHYSQSKNIAIIHNGIIENYAVLREALEQKGYVFQTDTDTEVLVQLIEYYKVKTNSNIKIAVQLALKKVVGTYAIAVLERHHPDYIVAARKGSPLVIGKGDNEYFLGSDASPIVEFTKEIVYLEENQIAVIDGKEGLKVTDYDNLEYNYQVTTVDLDISQIEKGGYPHFMLKEIFEQPESLRMCKKGRVNVDLDTIALTGFIEHKQRFLEAERIYITACGTSWHAGLIGKYLFEEFCRIKTDVEVASEFRYRNPVIGSKDIIIAISQSGETADTLAAVELANQSGAFTYGVCNVVGASIPRATQSGTYTHAGPEIGVASTKAFTTQVTVLAMLAFSIAKEKGTINEARFKHLVQSLENIEDQIDQILKKNDEIASMARVFTYVRNFIYLGRGYNYPVAMEGALKLKEISYIHAEGYPAAEMKHGPIALIDQDMPVIVIATSSAIYDKTVSNIQEIKSRGGRIIAIINEGDTVVRSLAEYVIEIPTTEECLSPLLTTIPLQMLAYHIAIAKGKDVDKPRNLAKSVTVE